MTVILFSLQVIISGHVETAPFMGCIGAMELVPESRKEIKLLEFGDTNV